MRISDWSSDVCSSDLKVEQHFDLAEDEDAATAAVRLRRVPAQNDLLPAVVMRSGNGSIDVVLADANTLTLDASASKWTGRAPSALAKRGDLAIGRASCRERVCPYG